MYICYIFKGARRHVTVCFLITKTENKISIDSRIEKNFLSTHTIEYYRAVKANKRQVCVCYGLNCAPIKFIC